MARVYCTKCRRLQQLCLCDVLSVIDNRVEILFLQHPLEQNHIKGTAWLTHLCLQNSSFQIGEVFDESSLNRWLKDDKPTFVLYPDTDDYDGCKVTPESFVDDDGPSECRVVVLDGTWKKTKKMMFLNPALAELPRIVINPDSPSNYTIRKQKNAQSLSTLEATMLLLQQLEQTDRYQALLTVMDALISQYEACVEKKGNV